MNAEPITITLTDSGKIADVDFVQWIMNEINDPVFKQADVATTYAILIGKGHKDFSGINKAILERWSPTGLRRIKTLAWKKLGCA